MEPEEDDWAVPKHYCDDNSGKKTDGDGNSIWNFLGGLLGGAVSGALTSLATAGITQAFMNKLGAGLTALGALANGALAAGMRVGGAADWANAKSNAIENGNAGQA